MKKVIILTSFVVTLVLPGQTFVYALFDLPAETAREFYLPGGTDDHVITFKGLGAL